MGLSVRLFPLLDIPDPLSAHLHPCLRPGDWRVWTASADALSSGFSLGLGQCEVTCRRGRTSGGTGESVPPAHTCGLRGGHPSQDSCSSLPPHVHLCWSLNSACPFLVDPSLNVPWWQEPDLQLRTLTHTELVSHPLRVAEVSLGSTKGSRTGLWSLPGKTYKPASLRSANSWPRVSLQGITQAPVEGSVSYHPHLSASMPDGSASNQRLTLPHNLIQGNASAKKMLYDRKQKVHPP